MASETRANDNKSLMHNTPFCCVISSMGIRETQPQSLPWHSKPVQQSQISQLTPVRYWMIWRTSPLTSTTATTTSSGGAKHADKRRVCGLKNCKGKRLQLAPRVHAPGPLHLQPQQVGQQCVFASPDQHELEPA